MTDRDVKKENLVRELQVLRTRIIKSYEANHKQDMALRLLSHINEGWEQGKFKLEQGFWKWDLTSGQVTFRVEKIHGDGLGELEDQFSGTWQDIVSPDALYRVITYVRGFVGGQEAFDLAPTFRTRDQQWLLRIAVDGRVQYSGGIVVAVKGFYWDCASFVEPFSRAEAVGLDPIAITLKAFFHSRFWAVTRLNYRRLSFACNCELFERAHVKLSSDFKRSFEKYAGLFNQYWKIPEDYGKVLRAREEFFEARAKLIESSRPNLQRQSNFLYEKAHDPAVENDKEKCDWLVCQNWVYGKRLAQLNEHDPRDLEEQWKDVECLWDLVELVYLLLRSHWDWGNKEGHSREATRLLFYATHRPDATVFIKDERMRYIYVSPGLTSLLDLPASYLIGRTDVEVFTDEGEWRIEQTKEIQTVSGTPILLVNSLTRQVGGENLGQPILMMSLLDTSEKGRTWHIGVAAGPEVDLVDESQLGTDAYKSKAMQDVLKLALAAAKGKGSILLTGETGSGKEYIAKYIHEASDRKSKGFRAVHLGAIPETLIESELFGHVMGAYTGATEKRIGKLEEVGDGTLLLDEVGDISASMQVKLLRVLQERKFERVGSNKPIELKARIIAATNKNLEIEMAEGRFRQDLFYRINVLSIRVPPLRERREDIPLLVAELMEEIRTENDRPYAGPVSPQTMGVFMKYDWPGNVRELRNVLERALMQSNGARVDVPYLGSRTDNHLLDTKSSKEASQPHEPVESERSEQSVSSSDRHMASQPMPKAAKLKKPTPEQCSIIFERCLKDGEWTIADVAEVFGRHPSTVSKWLSAADCPKGEQGRPSGAARDLDRLRLLIEEIMR